MGIIRVLLAVSVVLAHAGSLFGYQMIGGPLAVQTFFIVSGFYMSLILNEKYIGENGAYKLFITNRFLRLYPIYWAVLGCTLVAGILSYALTKQSVTLTPYIVNRHSLSFGTILFLATTNLTIFMQDLVLFLGLDIHTGKLFFTANFWKTDPKLYTYLAVPQAWSIAIELTFYLVAPFILRRSTAFIAGIIALSFLLRFLAAGKGLDFDPWSYRFFPFELAYFLLGGIGYRIYKTIRIRQVPKSVSLLFLGALLLSLLTYNSSPGIPYKNYIFLAQAFVSIPVVFNLTRKWKWDTAFGELSYPIYLVHIFILNYITDQALAALLLTFISAFVLNKTLGRRIERIRQARVTVAHKRQNLKAAKGVQV